MGSPPTGQDRRERTTLAESVHPLTKYQNEQRRRDASFRCAAQKKENATHYPDLNSQSSTTNQQAWHKAICSSGGWS
jgi:hypothetical protein